MPALKPQIRSMFATPVCLHFLPVAQEVNSQLRPLLAERLQNAASRGQGAYTAPDFEAWGNHHAQTLFRVLRELADSLTATRSGARIELDWKIGARRRGFASRANIRIWRRGPARSGPGVYYVDDGLCQVR